MIGDELTHPGPTARSGRGYSTLGVDKRGDADDANYRMCAQCGFPALIGRDQRGNSEDSPGLTAVTTTVSIPGGTTTIIEMNVVAGCPLCGSLNYEGLNKLRTVPARRPRTRR